MKVWNPAAYGSIVAELLADAPLNELGPGAPQRKAQAALDGLQPESLGAGRPVIGRSMALACCAALWLRRDYLDESHEISQNLDTLEGSYWHGILHRREPDFSNARYWMRRAPRHAIHPDLLAGCRQLAADAAWQPTVAELLSSPAWSSAGFVDLCEQSLADSNSSESHASAPREREPQSLELLVRRMQLLEWDLLFDHCYRAAFGCDSAGDSKNRQPERN